MREPEKERDEDYVYIPKNVQAKFELFQHIGKKESIVFIPSLIIDTILLFTPLPFHFIVDEPYDSLLSFVTKLAFIFFSIAMPYSLIATRPVRDNISAWQHFKWRWDFKKRQKAFYYKKEVPQNEIIEEKTTNIKKTRTIGTGFNTNTGA